MGFKARVVLSSALLLACIWWTLRVTSGATPAFSTNRGVHCISMFTADSPSGHPSCKQRRAGNSRLSSLTLTQTSQSKLNWCPGSKISIFHEMTLILKPRPRYGQDVTLHQKWSFYVNWFKSYNRHTHTTKTLPLPHTRDVIKSQGPFTVILEFSVCVSITLNVGTQDFHSISSHSIHIERWRQH